MPRFRILVQKLKTREAIRKGAFHRVQSKRQPIGEREDSSEQTKGVHQIRRSQSESTVSSRSSEDVDEGVNSQQGQRGRSSTRKQRPPRREESNESPNRRSDGDDSRSSMVEWSVSATEDPDDANKDYPSWTRCSFKPWNDPEESSEVEYIPPVMDEDFGRLSSLQGDPSGTFQPSPEQMQDHESDDDVSVASSASSNDSDSSDLDSLDNFLKKMFGCSAQQAFETKENEDEMINVNVDEENDIVNGDETDENQDIEPEANEWSKDSVRDMDSSDAIYTSHSSPSRRRSYKARSVLSGDEMSLSAVDSVIEMTNSKEQPASANRVLDADTIDEGRNPEASHQNSYNNSERKKEDCSKHDSDEVEKSSICQTDSLSEMPISDRNRKEAPEPSASTSESHGLNAGTAFRTKIDQPTTRRGKNRPFWIPITHPRAPNIIRDQVTMLPDNLAPMARLRYCRESISTAMYV
jgi:hypothetical protein